MQHIRISNHELLYSLQGFRYCDWQLFPVELDAWRLVLRSSTPVTSFDMPIDLKSHSQVCNEIERRATTTLAWVTPGNWLLDIALDNLTLTRVGLIRAILSSSIPQPELDLPMVATAVNGLRAAGQIDKLPLGLLTASLYHFVRGEHDLARKKLDETQQIAERAPMPLILADVHLHRARMFRDKEELAKAASLIRKHEYGRRYKELADAEQIISA